MRDRPSCVGSPGESKRQKGEQVGREAVPPEVAAAIRAMRADGLKYQAICDRLNADGVPTARGAAGWSVSAVQRSLGYKRPKPQRKAADLPDLPKRRRRWARSYPARPRPSGVSRRELSVAAFTLNGMNSEVRLVVIGSLIAGVAALGGALLGSCATIVTQRDQAQESRKAEARVKRASGYKTFLDDAERFADSTRRLGDAIETIITGRPRSGLLFSCLGAPFRSTKPKDQPLLKRCITLLDRTTPEALERCTTGRCRGYYAARAAYQPKRADFQAALNDVYIYGSRNGVRAARRVAGALPQALATRQPTFGAEVDERKYKAGYIALLDVMCREVSADPRPNC